MKARQICSFKQLRRLSLGFKPFLISFLFFGSALFSYGADPVFKLSLSDAPKTFDPHRSRSSSGNFLSQQIYRNFYTFDDKKSYVPDLGESCKVLSDLKWQCTLKKDLSWSDGSAITAMDFVLSIRRILTLSSPRADLLFNIENAKEVFEQTKKPDELGVRAVDSRTFQITWKKKSPDNNLVLMSPLFVPLPKGEYKKDVFSGPYQISDQNNQRILLSANQRYHKKNSRPILEFLIFEENLAVKAYEKKQLDFLRRIPTAQIPTYESKPDFHWYYVLRFDSIAFGPELRENLELRKKLTESLDYSELQKLFHSPGKIGCPGMHLDFASEVCYKGSQKFVKSDKTIDLSFAYSTSGGDDHRRLAEWLQSQWLTKLNVKLALQPLENKIFQSVLESKPPATFRRGLGFESPSCFNALQIYTTGHPDNYIGFKNKDYDSLISQLQEISTPKSQKRICDKAIKLLMDAYELIPTGRIHFAVMINPAWKGWKLNQLNHLDLSELELTKP